MCNAELAVGSGKISAKLSRTLEVFFMYKKQTKTWAYLKLLKSRKTIRDTKEAECGQRYRLLYITNIR